MYDAPSRATPSGGCWKTITIPAPDIHSAMEFHIEGPPARKGTPQAADYGPGGAGYVLDRPGGWKLHRGYVWRFERAMAPPILLVSAVVFSRGKGFRLIRGVDSRPRPGHFCSVACGRDQAFCRCTRHGTGNAASKRDTQ